MSALYWETIYEKLREEGFLVDWTRFYDARGHLLWCAHASRACKRWVVHAGNLTAAFAVLDSQTRQAVEDRVGEVP
jgi:hypothetical protein